MPPRPFFVARPRQGSVAVPARVERPTVDVGDSLSDSDRRLAAGWWCRITAQARLLCRSRRLTAGPLDESGWPRSGRGTVLAEAEVARVAAPGQRLGPVQPVAQHRSLNVVTFAQEPSELVAGPLGVCVLHRCALGELQSEVERLPVTLDVREHPVVRVAPGLRAASCLLPPPPRHGAEHEPLQPRTKRPRDALHVGPRRPVVDLAEVLDVTPVLAHHPVERQGRRGPEEVLGQGVLRTEVGQLASQPSILLSDLVPHHLGGLVPEPVGQRTRPDGPVQKSLLSPQPPSGDDRRVRTACHDDLPPASERSSAGRQTWAGPPAPRFGP